MDHQRYSLSLCFANGSIGGESAVTAVIAVTEVTTVTAVTAVAAVTAVTTVTRVATVTTVTTVTAVTAVTEPLMAKCFPALALCSLFCLILVSSRCYCICRTSPAPLWGRRGVFSPPFVLW